MGLTYYEQACKKGRRCYSDDLNRGNYPFLQVLEEITNHVTIVSESRLGIQEIPLDAVKGTLAVGRHNAFASNFMPLLGYASEFADKWETLAEAHVNEGIKDPILCYEYMNRYYVVEGNKRVSVLKFFGATTISANVIRMVPQRNDSAENIAYYEYLDFYKHCPANYLVFSKPGDYAEFLSLANVSPDHDWSEDERIDLRASFTRFFVALERMKQKNPCDVSVSDAYLVYLRIYGYKNSLNKVPDEIYPELEAIWAEICLTTTKDDVTLLMDPEAPQKKSFFDQIFGSSVKKLQTVFIYHDTPETSEWDYGHNLGRIYIDEHFGDLVETKVYQNIDIDNIEATLDKACEEGADIIFATSRLFLGACLKAAIKYPKVRILDCTINASHMYIRTYYARIFEAKFLDGVLAGCVSTNNKIGYLAYSATPADITKLNAFALGVKMVNPYAEVHAQWTIEEGSDPGKYFKEHDINLISGYDMVTPGSRTREFGLYRNENGTHTNLAMPITNWGILYKKLIESVQDGGFDNLEKNVENSALNYWWGMSSDVIDILISDHVPKETRRLIIFLKEQIRSGMMVPFYGSITAQNGRVISDDENGKLTPEEIMNMDWLCDNIIGHIPAYDELSDEGKKHFYTAERTE